MADVYTVTFIIIGILISLPALLVAFNLLMPAVTRKARLRLDQTPGRSFALGLPIMLVLIGFSAAAFGSNVGVLQTSAFLVTFLGMGVGTIGGAGLAAMLGDRLSPLARPNSSLTNLVRGALVFELACLVPFVGWFLFIPIAGITSMGAAVFALMGWLPRPKITVDVPPVTNDIPVTR